MRQAPFNNDMIKYTDCMIRGRWKPDAQSSTNWIEPAATEHTYNLDFIMFGFCANGVSFNQYEKENVGIV